MKWLLLILTSISTLGSSCADLFVNTPALNISDSNVSKVIRSNPTALLQFINSLQESNPKLYSKTSPFLKQNTSGLVLRDVHLGNWTILRVNKKLVYRFSDFDNSGMGPFVLDLVSLLANNKAIRTKMGFKRMIQAYLDGLKGASYPAPRFLKDLLDIKKDDLEKLQKDVIESKVKKDRLHGKEFSKVDPKIEKELTKFFEGKNSNLPRRVLDIASIETTEGGSAGIPRYWVLVKTKKDNLQIYEFKLDEVMKLDAGKIKDSAQKYKLFMDLTWEDSDEKHQLAEIGDKSYWMRPRDGLNHLYGGPFKTEALKNKKNLDELMEYCAFLLGTYHGKQAGSKAYQNLISESPDAFRKLAGEITDTYLDYIETEINNHR